MTWIVKRGQWEYIFAGSVMSDGARWVYEWTDDQSLAHRFGDRNQAASIVGESQADQDVRVVRLVPRKGGGA